ncbi:hypothetical protein AAFF_G00342940 [Aldrovandia affinis]|uniref:Uncharacterized protein n=1 Tax=Aldrovandia affinis TaxID=143900 RepID=A0AAD7SJZ2_9TELE|nr:hypothetical protein AAFF_G00342940 [Aldrovandia affinis]
MSDDGGQRSVSSMFAGRRCDARWSEEITQRVWSMIEKDMVPISVVDGQGFQGLLGYLEPNYKIPSRGIITSRIEAHFQEETGELKTQLATAKSVALTTDSWTALTTENYVTITCHYIDADWQVDTDDLVSKQSLIASILNPHHKHLRFLTPMERAAAKEKLQEIVTTLEVTTDVPIADEPATAATSGDEETTVPAAPGQAGAERQRQGNAMMLLLGDDYSLPQAQ